jgi:alpha-tubulin suppressor-like RCC1 family protein
MPSSTPRRTLLVTTGTLCLALLTSTPALADPASADVASGSNADGQLGTGNTTSTASFVPVLTPTGAAFTDVSSYDGHTLALTVTGELYAWGDNSSGQLGTGGSSSATPLPVPVPGVVFTDVAAGAGFSAAIGNGRLWTWGTDAAGQLGNGAGTTADVAVPTALSLPGVVFTQVSAGQSFVVALTDTGRTYAWGANGSGQLGIGGTAATDVPTTPASWPTGLVLDQVAAGEAFVVARSTDGQVYTWGENTNGQLGSGTAPADRDAVPAVAVAGLTVDVVGAGAYHALAADGAGHAWAWGRDSDGQLGEGSTPQQWANPTPLPVVMPSGVSFVDLEAGDMHSIAIGDDGTLYTWGMGAPGQLGTGQNTQRDVPTAVRTDPDVVTTAITGGSTWTIALGSRLVLTTVSGGGQSAPSGSAFSAPLTVAVSARGIGVAGRAVTFAATGATFAGGAGSVTVRTGADGRATAPALTAGSTLGAISVAATLDGTTSAASFPLTVLPAQAPEGAPELAPEVAPVTGQPASSTTAAGTAAPGPRAGQLAATGADPGPLAALGAVLVLAGAAALRSTRRRAD